VIVQIHADVRGVYGYGWCAAAGARRGDRDLVGRPGRLLRRSWAATGTVFNVHGIRGALRALGIFGDKDVPPIYLRASVKQRLALLQGLMDTDGSPGARKPVAAMDTG
jgi:hypothetical protein